MGCLMVSPINCGRAAAVTNKAHASNAKSSRESERDFFFVFNLVCIFLKKGTRKDALLLIGAGDNKKATTKGKGKNKNAQMDENSIVDKSAKLLNRLLMGAYR
jgi:hypothetical protein